MSEIIRIACHRTGPNWPETSSADLAAAITAPYALKKMTLTRAFQLAVATGGNLSEYGLVFRIMNDEFVNQLKTGLHNGDLIGVSIVVEIAKNDTALAWSQESKDAIDTVITTSSLRLVDSVAEELGETAPETVSGADVTAALNNAGYNWDQNTETWIKA